MVAVQKTPVLYFREVIDPGLVMTDAEVNGRQLRKLR